MARISLRVYNREIEGMIEGGQLEEAVAHCQHILKTFSMHIETYRLLGKAFLEARRYTDATDIFMRVLNAVPDDFVAHVGMSIIRDDEGKLDESIWHMERAFEVQPSNPAIQGELRRLYGKRDGVEPPKIRLSRDALANMYAQGELFNQAIAEIRSVLADDPNRPDLQVMLARAYFRVGQKVEAAEMAAQLLKKYPYCLDALRVLVEVLPGTARAENTQVYRQRLRLLDPYSSFVTGSVFNSDQVADATVNLERLEYQPGRQAATSQPTWAASLGIKLEEERRAGAQPAWLSEGQPGFPTEPAPPAAGTETGSAKEGEGLPEFMRTAGWEQSGDQPGEAPLGSGAQPPADEIAKGEIPDWLKSQIPPELSETQAPGAEPAPAEGADFPDWLTGIGSAASGLDSPEGAVGGQLSEEKPAEPASFTPTPEAEGETGIPSEASASLPSEPETLPSAPEETGETRPLGIEDDTMAWLENLAAKQGAKPEELLTKPEERTGDVPEWLKQTAEGQPEDLEQPPASEQAPIQPPEPSVEPAEAALLETKPLPDFRAELRESEEPLSEIPPSEATPEGEAVEPPGAKDETLSWLENLEGRQDAGSEEPLAGPEGGPEVVPDWLQKMAQEPEAPVAGDVGAQAEGPMTLPEEAAPEPVLPQESIAAESEIPEGAAIEEKPPVAEEDITITTWLKTLDGSGLLADVPPAPPDVEPSGTPKEGMPDWLKGLEEQTAKPVAGKEEKPTGAKTDLPDWLRGGEAPLPEEPIPQPRPGGEELPDWVAEEAKPEGPAAPTVPEEWLPVEKAETPPEPLAETFPSVEEPAASVAPAPPQAIVAKGTGVLSPIPQEDKDAILLSDAQSLLQGNRLDEAMKEYAKLIKKGRLLDEVIHDLREAIYRFPVDIIVWQSLGDAYMRANRLQDALDAYTKAEELLR
ncbi:MAG: tetratricopeptide repeat protein [Chloroflexota bacterium]